ncbi:hypothetical protein [Kaarinaea lacus]
MDKIPLPQVGAPDPEAKTSPIAEEFDEEYEVVKQEVPGEPVCYFNGTAYKNNQNVCSGSARLRCNYGVWMRTGSCDPDNP